jgi:PEP-CTERM motif
MSFRSGKLVLALGCLAFGAGCLKANVTYGTFNSGNCLPFMCNDSGTSSGQSIDYQQVYGASGFSGPATITAVDWYLDAADSGANVNLLGGSYTFYWGYAALGSVGNLSSALASNYISGPNLLGTAPIPAGGVAYGAVLFLTGININYDPSLGDLLLEIVVSGQDNVPNFSTNGYNENDNTGAVTSRALCITNGACGADNSGLVTTFETAAPEPGTLGMLGGALLGLGFLRKRLG